MMAQKQWQVALSVILCASVLAGCQSVSTLSRAVRTGDTFVVGLSGDSDASVTNTIAEVIRSEDVSAEIIDSSGTFHEVRVRSVFRVYGDPTASDLAANQGQWLAVIDLVDDSGAALDLSTGAATLEISSDKLIESMEVSTHILAGTGSPHPLTGTDNGFAKLPFLAPAPQALVSVSGNLGGKKLGAIQYHFHVPQESTASAFGPVSAIAAVKLQGRRDVSWQSWVAANPEGGTDLTILMTAPTGVAQAESSAWDVALLAGAIKSSDDPENYFVDSLQSARFYDTEGFELSEVQAVLGLVE